MTATTAFDRQIDSFAPGRARVHGVDRLIMKLSLSVLLWARKRADRAALGRDEHALLIDQVADRERREHDAALRVARVI